MAYAYFDSGYAPVGFLIVQDGADPYSDDIAETILVQSGWDFPSVAMRMGWVPCECGQSDGTVDCGRCGKTASDMIALAYDYIREHEGESFDSLDDYFQD